MNQFEGNKTNDVTYYFELDKLSNIELKYFAFEDSPSVPSIRMQLFIINENNEIVYTGQGNATEYKSYPLKKGRYRIVMEGIDTNGILVLYIKNSRFKSSNELGEIYIGDKKTLLSNTAYLADEKDKVAYNFKFPQTQSIQLSNIGNNVYVKLLDEIGKVYINQKCQINDTIYVEGLSSGKYSLIIGGYNEMMMNLEVCNTRNVVDINPEYESLPLQFSHSMTFSNTGTTSPFYKFYLREGGLLDISQCRKGTLPYLVSTEIHILDKNFRLVAPVKYFNLYSENTCSNEKRNSLNINLEKGGIYYVAVKGLTTLAKPGEYPTSIYETITTSINVGEKRTIIDLGRRNTTFDFLEVINTDNSTNSDVTFPTNEIYYKLHVPQTMKLNINNCNSEIQNTRISIYKKSPINNDFHIIATSKDSDKIDCSGTKYSNISLETGDTDLLIGVEGISQNGNITVNIKGVPINDNYYGSKGCNYINKRTYLSENSREYIENIQYFDELGNAKEEINVSATPSKADLVTYIEYDEIGRQSKIWQPVSISFNGGSYTVHNEVKNNSKILYNDEEAYVLPIYEASPLNRIVEQYSPGEDWHIKGRSVKTAYLCNVSENDSLSCITYSVLGMTHTPSLSQCGNYPTAELYVIRTEDENGNISYEFKDKLGQVVLTRQINGGINHDTYYVYDDFGNLCFVLPPRIQEEGISQDTLDKLAYQYRYDYRNRCIAKKLPACDWIYYAYDKADQLIFTQDGEQRVKGEWLFSIPDAFGRIALTGICSDTIPIFKKVIKAEYPSDESGIYQGYQIKADNESITFSSYKKLLTANYYDDYDFLGKNGFPNQTYDNSKESAGFGKRYDEGKGYEAKGQLTGTIAALFGSSLVGDSLIYTTMYYDNRSRLIQTHSSNHLGGKETEYLAYNFTGQPVKKLHVHSSGNMNPKQELYTYTYDHAGRLMETTHQLDNASPIVLAKNEYDELGRLKNVKRADNENLQTNYTYNIRSWTKSISSPLFTQNLYYNEEKEDNTPSYNGNISRIEWTNAGNSNKAYNFGYDALSQLKTADYSGEGKYGASYSYDKHGNMLTLERKGKTNTGHGTVDQLAMTYNGNQLVNVKDDGANVTINESADFKDYSNGNGLYEYNTNGAMTKDLHKGISNIEYNSLNLPVKMDILSPIAEARNEYLYSSAGVKLRVTQRWNTDFQTSPIIGETINEELLDVTKVTDYVGNKIYENGELIKILVDGGYYDVAKEKYFFYIQDHLGNNRVVADAQGNVVQRSDYYPFGMEFADNSDQDEQPYKYNGKELDKMHGLNMYDYSARYMEPAIGRFTSVDPLAEKYYSISPYVYVGNNPITRIDPIGMDWIENKETGDVEWRKDVNKDNVPKGYNYIGESYMGISILIYKQKNYQTKDGYYSALEVRIGYTNPETGEQESYGWIQTVKRDDRDLFIDQGNNNDNFPFYQTKDEYQMSLNKDGYDITFNDEPDERQSNGYFKAELSLVGKKHKVRDGKIEYPYRYILGEGRAKLLNYGKKIYNPIITMQYGFSVKDGKMVTSHIKVITPSNFQIQAIDKIK